MEASSADVKTLLELCEAADLALPTMSLKAVVGNPEALGHLANWSILAARVVVVRAMQERAAKPGLAKVRFLEKLSEDKSLLVRFPAMQLLGDKVLATVARPAAGAVA